MRVNKIELIISAVSSKQYPDLSLPEIALAGRSNVGKSSFINTLVNRKGIARTSSKPGKTQTLNFYNIDDRFRFVDVPGYGYAQVSRSERDKWARMIEEYLFSRKNLQGLFLLMDFRHPPTDLDISMRDFAEELDIPYGIIATKADKIKASQHNKHIKTFIDTLDLPGPEAIFVFSSETREGSQKVWEVIEDLIQP